MKTTMIQLPSLSKVLQPIIGKFDGITSQFAVVKESLSHLSSVALQSTNNPALRLTYHHK